MDESLWFGRISAPQEYSKPGLKIDVEKSSRVPKQVGKIKLPSKIV
jgi:hypothetical protein